MFIIAIAYMAIYKEQAIIYLAQTYLFIFDVLSILIFNSSYRNCAAPLFGGAYLANRTDTGLSSRQHIKVSYRHLFDRQY